MSRITECAAWTALQSHRQSWEGRHLRALFAEDSGRFDRFSRRFEISGGGALLADFSKALITQETLDLLVSLAHERGLEAKRDAMLSGAKINATEGRAVLHTALRNRSGTPILVDGQNVMPEVDRVLTQMRRAVTAVRDGSWRGFTGERITDIVNIGIGGSDLGPLMVTKALTPWHQPGLTAHFVSNVDGTHIAETLKRLDPARTLFIIASKTFTTQETLTNAATARRWFVGQTRDEAAIAKHFIALSTNTKAVTEFGIAPENMFEFWDWVGGRYSLWSAIGMPIALMVGMDRFEELLAGAHAVDRHFATAPMDRNVPVLMALIGLWYRNFWQMPALAVLPYDQYLDRLPAYLQQLDMESNGKAVTLEDEAVDHDTGPILFGEAGTNGQHAFYQLIHQGPTVIAADFIAPIKSQNPVGDPAGDHHAKLLANVLAQTQALMRGRTTEEARAELLAEGKAPEVAEALARHKTFAGNRPTTTLLVPELDPMWVGALIALYENKVFAQGALWGVNSFDQWGVELGKQLAKPILKALTDHGALGADDSSTAGLIAAIRAGS